MTLEMQILTFGPGQPGGLNVDLDKLLAGRLAVQGNSGSGKSWLLRTLLEGTHGAVQHLVVDPEGEYRTLREVFDDYVILAAAGGDLDVTPETAARPVAELIRAGANVVLDLSDFDPEGRDAVCAAAITALMALPRSDWRHLLVVVEEAQTLAPEGGREGAARRALIDLATRGRKRGFGLVVATQRLALLSKSLLAGCNNRLVGLTTLGNDLDRAAAELGFDRSQRDRLRTLAPGEWYAYGAAVSQEVVLVRSGPVKSTHPEPGRLAPPTPPASEALAAVIAQLGAREPEARHGESIAPEPGPENPNPGVSEAEVRRRVEAAVARAVADATKPLEARLERYRTFVANLRAGAGALEQGDGPLPADPPPADQGAPPGVPGPVPEAAEKRPLERHVPPGQADPGPALPAPQRRILGALAEVEVLGVKRLDRRTAAVLSKQSPKSSAYGAHVAALNSAGLIFYPGDGELALTDAGRASTPPPGRPPTRAELHRRWLGYLGDYEADLLRVLIDHHPWPLQRPQLAAKAGRSVNSSAFGAAVAALEQLGLASYPGKGAVKATELLFPAGLEPKRP